MGVQMLDGASVGNPPSSASPENSVFPGRLQWATQCATAGERASAYVQAQKLRGRIQNANAPQNRMFKDMADLSTELAMRGNAHVIDGLSKGARQSSRTGAHRYIM